MVELTLKAPITKAADDTFYVCIFFFLHFLIKNKSWHFKWIFCFANDSHEMSIYLLWKKKQKKKTTKNNNTRSVNKQSLLDTPAI